MHFKKWGISSILKFVSLPNLVLNFKSIRSSNDKRSRSRNRNKLKNKAWLIGGVSATLLGVQAGNQSLEALANTCSTEEECQALIDETKNELSQLEQETSQKEETLSQVEDDIDSLMIRIEKTEASIEKAVQDIAMKEKEIKQSEKQLKALDVEISELKETVTTRMQMSRRLSRTNTLLNWVSEATSLVDLIRSLQTINHFASQDAVRMDELKEKVQEQQELMRNLKDQQESLEKTKASLEADQVQLERDQKVLEEKRQAVKEEIQALESERLSVQEAQAIAQEQKAFLEKLAAEEEKRRQEEEEKKKQEELLQQQQQQQGGGTTESTPESTPSEDSNSGSSSVIPSSTTFRIPLATGYVSCEFMCYPGHNGIDLGNSGNTSTPVLATASGIVTRAGWHHAYGNHVMITHNINGQLYTTVYAHMHTSPYVSVGDVVYQGQQIGTMGNTGNSFGAHLHFELYEGYYNYPYSVNPRKYIHFPSRW